MKKNTITYFILIGLSLTLLSFEIPAGWSKAGSEPNSYDMGIEKGAGMNGKNAATVKSIANNIVGFGTLMQYSSAEKFLGKRIRLSGYVKTKDVVKKSCFWLRVERTNSQISLAFDNMQDRPIVGTTDWKKYEIVLDVPSNATKISYGGLLKGTGQIWFYNLAFEIVDNSIPTTGRKNEKTTVNAEPFNLDFDK